jgi:hypothetical protein
LICVGGRAVDLQLLSEELGTYNEAERFPFQGISLENKETSCENVEIMLGGSGADHRNLTHTVKEVSPANNDFRVLQTSIRSF